MSLLPTVRPGEKPRFSETTIAIVGSFVVALILGTILTGNPFRAMIMAYTDYSGTPAAGAEKASTTRAPQTEPQVKAEESGQK